MVTPMVLAQKKPIPLVAVYVAEEVVTYTSDNPCQICGKHFMVQSKMRKSQRCCGDVCRLRRKSLRRVEWNKSISRRSEVVICPHPSKKEFRSARSAWNWIDARHHAGENIFPYDCKCGVIHIGHDEVGDRTVYNRQGAKAISAEVK